MLVPIYICSHAFSTNCVVPGIEKIKSNKDLDKLQCRFTIVLSYYQGPSPTWVGFRVVKSCGKMFFKSPPFGSVMSLFLKGGWGSREDHFGTLELCHYWPREGRGERKFGQCH